MVKQSESDLTNRTWPNWRLAVGKVGQAPDDLRWWLTAVEMIGDEPGHLIAGCDVSGPDTGAGK